MEQRVNAVLADYEARARDEAQQMQSASQGEFLKRIDDFLLCVGPDTGQLLHLLVVSAGARTIVEVGASYGYSTVWLADAARATGGKVLSLELSQKKVDYAHAQLQRAGLDAYVQFHVGDALATLAALPAPLDFVLVDLWKDLYCPCLNLFHPKLAPGALVVADNMLTPVTAREHAQAYQQLVREKGDMDSVLLPIGSGVELSRKRPA